MTEPRIFYYSVNKHVEDMSVEELETEIETAQRYYARCKDIGQGINSKEVIRRRRCEERLRELTASI